MASRGMPVSIASSDAELRVAVLLDDEDLRVRIEERAEPARPNGNALMRM